MLGINKKALAILTLLNPEANSKLSNYLVQSYAWYNGRECGVSLVARPRFGGWGDNRVIVFGENRNSDQLFVDTWIRKYPVDPPTAADLPEEAYFKRTFFNSKEYDNVVDHIVFLINSTI